MKLSILYRGSLSSCNYACGYCPFAKRSESSEDLKRDREELGRFAGWVGGRRADRLRILFTPWGEALVRPWYRQALVQLSRLPQVKRVAIQTNLSVGLDWITACDPRRLAIWASFHPSQVSRATFLARCHELDLRGIRFSVGVVGLKRDARQIEALRRELPPEVYLWINAYKHRRGYYDAETTERFTRIDPLFPFNQRDHPSRGHACQAGETIVAVDGRGTIRRCHFIRKPLGNLYEPGFERRLARRPCTRPTCGCYIGYAGLEHLRLDEFFGDGALERIPDRFVAATPFRDDEWLRRGANRAVPSPRPRLISMRRVP
jgi:MoaA/NifB/PqqE/SkfB family radical SAM enzyme